MANKKRNVDVLSVNFRYAEGFEERTVRRMMKFAQMFPDLQILTPLVTKLSWTHFLIVMPLKDELQRELPEPTQRMYSQTIFYIIFEILEFVFELKTGIKKSHVEAWLFCSIVSWMNL